jgi:hypothetical protein
MHAAQVRHSPYRSLMHCARATWQEGGIRAFYNSYWTTVGGAGSGAGGWAEWPPLHASGQYGALRRFRELTHSLAPPLPSPCPLRSLL